MQIDNDYEKEVYNGDVGTIDGIDPDEGEVDGRASTAATVTTASASSTSWCPPTPRRSTRARAREYPAVVIPVLTQHYAMLQRNLLYTGVTRGKQLVVLVGQTKAVAIAVQERVGSAALVEAA